MEKETEKSAWNLSESIIFEMANHFQNASRLYIDGNFSKAFGNLKCINHRLSAYFSEEELKEFKRLENDMVLSINISNITGGFQILSNDQMVHKLSLRIKYDNYNLYLMRTIKKYGLYFSERKDRTLLST